MGYWVIEELNELAKQGDADAQFDLGSHYFYGEFVEPDVEKALYYWTLAAKQGNVDALCELGEYYCYCDNSAMHYQTAVDYWKKAVTHGSMKAHYHLSRCYFLGNGVSEDYHKAIEHCRIPAEKGMTEAQYLLGEYYRVGFNDFDSANKWYEKAAEQGFSKAQHNLAIRYHNAKDYKTALAWFEKAAKQGYVYSQYNLGNAYLYGLGVEQNVKQAKKWFLLAAMQGDKTAQKVSSFLHEKFKYQNSLDKEDFHQLNEILNRNPVCPFCKSPLDKNDTKCDDCGARKVEIYEPLYITSAALGSAIFGFILSLFIAFTVGTDYHHSSFVLKTWAVIGTIIFCAFIFTMKSRKREVEYKWKRYK